MENGEGWTVISDQQKGLIGAIESLWPEAEHRNCARHAYKNWNKKHKGKVLEKQFWRCTKATSKETGDDISGLRGDYPSYWVVLRQTVDRAVTAIMERMRKKKEFVAGVAPRISLKLIEAYDEQRKCECRWNGEDSQTGFEVIHNGVAHAVDIEKKTCSCRGWDLTGIPCCHGMSALLYMRHQPEKFLPKWYTLETYNETYSNMLKHVPGSTYWEHEGKGLVLPPDIVKSKKGGRRKKARSKDVDETPKNNREYCRKGLPTKCSNCGEQEHDKRKCTVPTNLTQALNFEADTMAEPKKTWNRGRKKGGNNRLGGKSSDVRTATEYVKLNRGRKDARHTVDGEGTTSSQSSWLEIATVTRGGARRRGRERLNATHGRSTEIPGIGLYYGDHGEVSFRASMTSPTIVINDPITYAQGTQPTPSNGSQRH